MKLLNILGWPRAIISEKKGCHTVDAFKFTCQKFGADRGVRN